MNEVSASPPEGSGRRSAATAALLSSVIPGWGHALTGRTGEAWAWFSVFALLVGGTAVEEIGLRGKVGSLPALLAVAGPAQGDEVLIRNH